MPAWLTHDGFGLLVRIHHDGRLGGRARPRGADRADVKDVIGGEVFAPL